MTRLVLIAVSLCALAACDKPTDADCRKAISNMQHLLGTENLNAAQGVEADVRACREGSKKPAVACAIKAQTEEELKACDFYKVPSKHAAGSGSANGSAK